MIAISAKCNFVHDLYNAKKAQKPSLSLQNPRLDHKKTKGKVNQNSGNVKRGIWVIWENRF